jgi:hypothetical protein
MKTLIDADTARLAGLQIDLLNKIRQGNISLSHFEWFLSLTKTQRDTHVLNACHHPYKANIPKPISDTPPRWYRKGGIIYLTIVTATEGVEEWISSTKWCSKNNIPLDSGAVDILQSAHFKPPHNCTIELAIITSENFGEEFRTLKNYNTVASKLGMHITNPEMACLIHVYYSKEELEAMGIASIIIMHERMDVSGNDNDCPHLLSILPVDTHLWITGYRDEGALLPEKCGVAFEVSRTQN